MEGGGEGGGVGFRKDGIGFQREGKAEAEVGTVAAVDDGEPELELEGEEVAHGRQPEEGKLAAAVGVGGGEGRELEEEQVLSMVQVTCRIQIRHLTTPLVEEVVEEVEPET